MSCQLLTMNVVLATKYKALRLKAGQFLRVIDIEGEQVVDLTAFRFQDTSEWLSNGRCQKQMIASYSEQRWI